MQESASIVIELWQLILAGMTVTAAGIGSFFAFLYRVKRVEDKQNQSDEQLKELADVKQTVHQIQLDQKDEKSEIMELLRPLSSNVNTIAEGQKFMRKKMDAYDATFRQLSVAFATELVADVGK